jgi:KAT8 regulatory NSL complex subunit 2
LLEAPLPQASRRALETSDVDSDSDVGVGVEALWKDGDADSDVDSVDSDMEDPLKYAGAYSAEEVIRTLRDKLAKLQKLYIDQFQRMQYHLREERRKYKHAVAKEKEDMLGPIHAQIRLVNAVFSRVNLIRQLSVIEYETFYGS